MKYQDIEVLLRQAQVPKQLMHVIQHLHAENVGLKQEINQCALVIDKLADQINAIATVAGVHQQIFKGLEDGKSMSDIVSELRAEHLSDIRSEAADGS